MNTINTRCVGKDTLWLPCILIVSVLLLVGCGDDTSKESKPIKPKQEIVESKPTYATPKFHLNGKLYSKELPTAKLKPHKVLTASGNVKDILVENSLLYAATDAGVVDIFDLTTHKRVDQIVIPSFHDDIYDKDLNATIYSVDKVKDRVVLLTSYKGVKKRLFVYENRGLSEIKGLDPSMMIIKIRMIDKSRVLLGLLSNELILYDIDQKKQLYRTSLSESSFSDMALSRDKSSVVVGCESGIIYLVDVATGQLKSVIQGANRDKSYKVDIKNNLVLSAGQDKIGAIYNIKNNSFKILEANFLIYAGALSPDGSRAIFAYNEENELLVVSTSGESKEAYLLSGQKSTLNAIRFRDNQNIISASDDEFIMLWQLP